MAEATPSSPSSATSSTTPSCASPRPVRRSRTSASRPPPASRQADQRVEGRRQPVPHLHVWRQAAENVAESLQRGMRVIVQGRLKQRSYETREGEKRTVLRDRGRRGRPEPAYATAKVTKTQRGGGSGGFGGRRGRRRATTRGPRRPRQPLRAALVATAAAGTRRAPLRRAGVLSSPTSRRHLTDRPSRLLRRASSDWSTTMAKPPLRKPKKKVCQFCKDKIDLHRLQGHRPAAEVHLRPRQDPRPPGHRQLHPAPARRRHGREEQPRDGAAALHQHGALRGATTMKLILTQEVAGLGAPGDVVEVKDGYGRNYLVPRGAGDRAGPAAARSRSPRSGGPARSATIRDLGHAKASQGPAREPERVKLPARAGEAGRLFGSVTVADIVEAVHAGRRPGVDKRRIEIGQPRSRPSAPTRSPSGLHPEVAATLSRSRSSPPDAKARTRTGQGPATGFGSRALLLGAPLGRAAARRVRGFPRSFASLRAHSCWGGTTRAGCQAQRSALRVAPGDGEQTVRARGGAEDGTGAATEGHGPPRDHVCGDGQQAVREAAGIVAGRPVACATFEPWTVISSAAVAATCGRAGARPQPAPRPRRWHSMDRAAHTPCAGCPIVASGWRFRSIATVPSAASLKASSASSIDQQGGQVPVRTWRRHGRLSGSRGTLAKSSGCIRWTVRAARRQEPGRRARRHG